MATRERNRRSRHGHGIRAKFDAKTGIVRLNVPLSVKADAVDQSARTFEGLAATWDEDLGQDVIHKGAFKASIGEWKAGGEAMPLLNSHDQFNIFSALGQAVTLKETDAGLFSKWEVIDGPDGDAVLTRLRPSKTTGRAVIGKMSIGFIPEKFSFEQPPGTESFFDRIRHITQATLKEVSLVLFPMNPNASIDASTVKMWLKMAHDTDPRRLDPLARLELRRLNSRIGLLLKKQQPEGDEELDEDEEEQRTPPSRKSSARKPERKDDDTGDEADDLDDEELDDEEDDSGDTGDGQDDGDESDDESDGDEGDDDSDDESGDDESDDDESDEEEDTDDAGQPKSAKGKHEKKGKEGEEPATYEFSEALSQRIKKIGLREKTSGALARDRSKT